MGKHIIFDDDLFRVELGDGEWIDILELIPTGIRRKAQAAAMPMRGEMAARDRDDDTKPDRDAMPVKVDFKLGEFNRVLCEEMIKAWSFKDKSGQPLAVTPDNIERLSEIDTDIVIAAIDKLNPERSKKAKKG